MQKCKLFRSDIREVYLNKWFTSKATLSRLVFKYLKELFFIEIPEFIQSNLSIKINF